VLASQSILISARLRYAPAVLSLVVDRPALLVQSIQPARADANADVERVRARLARGRLLTAKLLYEWVARRLGAGGIQTLVAEVAGAATGFAFAALYLDADLLAALPKTIVP